MGLEFGLWKTTGELQFKFFINSQDNGFNNLLAMKYKESKYNEI